MSSVVEFRRAGPEDAAVVRDLTRKAYVKWCEVIGREPLPMTADYDHAVRHHVIDIAYEVEREEPFKGGTVVHFRKSVR